MVEHADVLDIYRTYPHVDMAATGRRSTLQLAALIEGGTRLHKAYRQLPFMIPLTSGSPYAGRPTEVYHQVRLLAQVPAFAGLSFACETGRAHACTPVPNAHRVRRPLLE